MFRGRGTAVFVTDELGYALDAAFPGQCRLRHIRETICLTVSYPQDASVFAVHGRIKPRDREPKLDTGVDSQVTRLASSTSSKEYIACVKIRKAVHEHTNRASPPVRSLQ